MDKFLFWEDGAEDFTSLICSFPLLSRIGLMATWFHDEQPSLLSPPPSLVEPRQRSSTTITSLELRQDVPPSLIVSLLSGAINLRLRWLHLGSNLQQRDAPLVRELLRTSEESLECLKISQCCLGSSQYISDFSLTNHKQLSVIDLATCTIGHVSQSHFTWITAVLHSTYSTWLRSLSISGSLHHYHDMDFIDWNQVDADIVRLARNAPNLKISISFITRNSTHGPNQCVEPEMLSERLPMSFEALGNTANLELSYRS